MKLKVSQAVISNYTTKLRSSKCYSTGTKADMQINGAEQSREIKPQLYGQLNYDKGGANIWRGKVSLFNKWCWENWRTTCERIKLVNFLTSHTKIHSKGIKDLNVRPEAIKLIRKTLAVQFLISFLAIFFWIRHLRQRKQKQK